jgi:hypothetical protein
MGPVTAWAAAKSNQSAAPNRLAFLYVPNGVNMSHWTPKQEGTDFELPEILQPLSEHRGEFSVLTGLTADGARPHGDGGGDHARALAAFLTGAHPRKTDGTDIRNGVSVDQIAAGRLGTETRLASLEIGCEAGQMAGNCDSGYSCVYSSTMAWKSATQPLPKEVNPKNVFERLFAQDIDTQHKARDARRRSVLDYIHEDAKDLSGKLGPADQRKLDQYFTSIREIETRMQKADNMPPLKTPDMAKPEKIPSDYQEHLRLMADLMVLAFQADITRVCTFVLANEGSNKAYPFIQVSEGHHDLSHHSNDTKKLEKIRNINIFHMKQFAYLLSKLKEVKEGDGTLLDHCLLAYGSGNSDGNRHNHDDLPIVLAGRGGGTVKPGQHLRYAKETPLANLWVSLLERVDVRVPFVGDSSGALTNLA